MRNVKKYQINKIPEVRFLGRNIKGVENTSGRVLFWNGSGFEVHFKGQELWALVEADYSSLEPWIAIFLNGRINSRQMVTKGRHWICLARGFDNSYQSDIRVIKDSQPMTDDSKHFLKIHKLALSKGGQFEALPESDLKIEFIGDSITTGEGLYGAVGDMDWISCHMSFSKTYAYTSFCDNTLLDRFKTFNKVNVIDIYNSYEIVEEIELVCIYEEETIIDAFAQRFPKLTIYKWGTWGSDVVNKGCTKGRAITDVIKLYGYDFNNTYGIGDGLNDIEMFNSVNHSIAMGNASDYVKKHAKHVTSNIEDDGLEEVLEDIIYGKM